MESWKLFLVLSLTVGAVACLDLEGSAPRRMYYLLELVLDLIQVCGNYSDDRVPREHLPRYQ